MCKGSDFMDNKKIKSRYFFNLDPLLFLMAAIFFIPISTSLKSIFMMASIIVIILTKSSLNSYLSIVKQTWFYAAVSLFFFVVLGVFYGKGSASTHMIFIEKYAKLLILPILVLGFQDQWVRKLGIYAFLSSMFITAVLSLIKAHFVFIFPGNDPGQIFHNHIITSFMMAFAAYLSGILLRNSQGYLKYALICAWVIFSYQILFINTGRMGYIIYFSLMILWLVELNNIKKASGYVLIFVLTIICIAHQTKTFLPGAFHIVEDLQSYHLGNQNTSVGYRIRFHQYAKKLFLERPVLGQGTGGFSARFETDKPIPSWPFLLDPHSQYWLVAAEGGIIGLIVFFGFILSLLYASREMHAMKPIMMGLILALILGNFTDSLLFYSTAGYFFIVFTALCLGETLPQKQNT